jgi:hypothetical protein
MQEDMKVVQETIENLKPKPEDLLLLEVKFLLLKHMNKTDLPLCWTLIPLSHLIVAVAINFLI